MAIRKTYLNHTPDQSALERIGALRVAFSKLEDLIEISARSCRERSEAVTHLQSAAMWAVKAIVLNDPGSVPDGRCPAHANGERCCLPLGHADDSTHGTGGHRWAGGD